MGVLIALNSQNRQINVQYRTGALFTAFFVFNYMGALLASNSQNANGVKEARNPIQLSDILVMKFAFFPE